MLVKNRGGTWSLPRASRRRAKRPSRLPGTRGLLVGGLVEVLVATADSFYREPVLFGPVADLASAIEVYQQVYRGWLRRRVVGEICAIAAVVPGFMSAPSDLRLQVEWVEDVCRNYGFSLKRCRFVIERHEVADHLLCQSLLRDDGRDHRV
jgi:hypothetical protein